MNEKSVADVWRLRALEAEKQLWAACEVAMRVGITLPDDSPLTEEWESEPKPNADDAMMHWLSVQGWEPRAIDGVTRLVSVDPDWVVKEASARFRQRRRE